MFKEGTLLAVKLFDDVLVYLKTYYQIGDEISCTDIEINFNCGVIASLKLIEMLADFGYISHNEAKGNPRKVIKLPL